MSARNPDDPCGIVDAVDAFGGRWKGSILWWLQDGPRRFGELRRLVAGVTPKVLTQSLRQLEKDGLVSRKQFEEIPPRVEYGLTDLGQSALPLLDAIAEWWRSSREAVGASRSSFGDGADQAAD